MRNAKPADRWRFGMLSLICALASFSVSEAVLASKGDRSGDDEIREAAIEFIVALRGASYDFTQSQQVEPVEKELIAKREQEVRRQTGNDRIRVVAEEGFTEWTGDLSLSENSARHELRRARSDVQFGPQLVLVYTTPGFQERLEGASHGNHVSYRGYLEPQQALPQSAYLDVAFGYRQPFTSTCLTLQDWRTAMTWRPAVVRDNVGDDEEMISAEWERERLRTVWTFAKTPARVRLVSVETFAPASQQPFFRMDVAESFASGTLQAFPEAAVPKRVNITQGTLINGHLKPNRTLDLEIHGVRATDEGSMRMTWPAKVPILDLENRVLIRFSADTRSLPPTPEERLQLYDSVSLLQRETLIEHARH